MRDDTIAIYEGWTRTTFGGRREEERRQSQNAFGAGRRVRNLVCHLTVKSFVVVVRLEEHWRLRRLGFRI